MAQHLLRQPNNDGNNNNNINNDEDEEEEVVTLSVTASKAVDVDFNNTGDEGGGGSVGGGGVKAARLPRWTRQEILVLIQGKRVAENRVRRGRNATFCEGEGQQQQVEPKWATVSSYCKRHGVNRGPVQCRKRWSNLAGDFKKIKEWESLVKDESDSFWLMRNDLRREKKLPGFFDREVFDILNNNNNNTNTATCSGSGSLPPDSNVEPLFDSGRSAAADDGLFSDFEHTHHQQQQQQRQQQHGQQEDEIMGDNHNQVEIEIKVESQPQHHHNHPDPPLLSSPNLTTTTIIPAPTPISEKQYQPKTAEVTPPGTNNEKQQDGLNVEIGSTSREGRKRRRSIEEDDNNGEQDELCQVLEKNGRILSAQLDAYNINLKLDREERKDNANSLVAVLNKLADSLGRIADKL